VKAFVEFGHSSDKHLQLSDYPERERGVSLVLCIDCDPPSHFAVCLVEGMGTLKMLYSYERILEILQQERNMNRHLADQVKASEKLD
jgi:hypothetical protein